MSLIYTATTVIGFSAKGDHVGKLDVSLFTRTPWLERGIRTHSVLPRFESCPPRQADTCTRAEKTSDGASDRTFSHMACHLGEAERRAFVVPHDVVILLKHGWHTSQDTSSRLEGASTHPRLDGHPLPPREHSVILKYG